MHLLFPMDTFVVIPIGFCPTALLAITKPKRHTPVLVHGIMLQIERLIYAVGGIMDSKIGFVLAKTGRGSRVWIFLLVAHIQPQLGQDNHYLHFLTALDIAYLAVHIAIWRHLAIFFQRLEIVLVTMIFVVVLQQSLLHRLKQQKRRLKRGAMFDHRIKQRIENIAIANGGFLSLYCGNGIDGVLVKRGALHTRNTHARLQFLCRFAGVGNHQDTARIHMHLMHQIMGLCHNGGSFTTTCRRYHQYILAQRNNSFPLLFVKREGQKRIEIVFVGNELLFTKLLVALLQFVVVYSIERTNSVHLLFQLLPIRPSDIWIVLQEILLDLVCLFLLQTLFLALCRLTLTAHLLLSFPFRYMCQPFCLSVFTFLILYCFTLTIVFLSLLLSFGFLY